jgi:hypothetical protein
MAIPGIVSRQGSFQADPLPSVSRWRAIPIFFALFALLAIGRAETFGDFNYTTNGSSVSITGYTGHGGNVIVPDSISDKPVTSIGENAFFDCNTITSINIPVGVSSIGGGAFSGCSTLTDITIPYTVNYIGISAFSYCVSLTSITVPNRVKNIASAVFTCCTSLTNVTIPNSVTIIESSAFQCCSSLTTILIPNSVTTIGISAFWRCTGLTNVTIPAKVSNLGGSAFSGCNNLTSITVDTFNSTYASVDGVLFNKSQTTLIQCPGGKNGSCEIPNSVTNIGIEAFYGCENLANIIIPNSVITIGNKAFYACTGLTNAIISDSVNSIGDNAFYGCTSLTNLSIPHNVTTIGSYAFYGCSGITSVTIPNSVRNIGGYAFYDCTSLVSVTIGNSVTNLGPYAFYGCKELTGITIPDSITSIGAYTFSGCTSLTSVLIPKSVTNIDRFAFTGCTNMANIDVDILNTVYGSFGGVLFNKNQTTLIQCPKGMTGSYVIPDSVTNIADWGFAGCQGLRSILIPGSVPRIGVMTFNGCSGLENVTIPDSVTNIGNGAFNGCIGLTNITIPDGISCIGSDSFFNCSSLTNITIPGSLTNIGLRAFSGCAGLTNLSVDPLNDFFSSKAGVLFDKCQTNIIQYPGGKIGNYVVPDSVSYISLYAFNDCLGLSGMTIPKSVTSTGLFPFPGCTNLSAITVDELNENLSSIDGVLFNKHQTTLIQYPPGKSGSYVIPQGVLTISDRAFYGCSLLTKITIPNSVTWFQNNAFQGCAGLTSITIPNSVVSMSNQAFQDCEGLKSVYFEGDAPTSYYEDLFTNATNVTVYYRPGTKGWSGLFFAGRPTALWIEQTPFQQWSQTFGLLDKFPNASGETDDADQDGMTNLAEMQAGTDPTMATSALRFERAPRLADLTDDDKTAVGSDRHALYFQSVPGKQYKIESVSAFGEAWQSETSVTATTSQKRVLVTKPLNQRFYRVVLVQ